MKPKMCYRIIREENIYRNDNAEFDISVICFLDKIHTDENYESEEGDYISCLQVMLNPERSDFEGEYVFTTFTTYYNNYETDINLSYKVARFLVNNVVSSHKYMSKLKRNSYEYNHYLYYIKKTISLEELKKLYFE